jgi:pyrroline-5-carboxylate reductase
VSNDVEDRGTVAVIGAGNMGSSLIQGLLQAGWDPEMIYATGPDPHKMKRIADDLGVHTTTDNNEAAEFADTIVLAVKPQILAEVLDEIAPHVPEDTLVVSIAAGVPTTKIEDHLSGGQPVVRTMPNLPATVDAGASAMSPGQAASNEHLATTRRLFESVGTVVEVDERLMDAVTGLSGTGPMYVFQIIEGLSDAGVKVGLSRSTAHELAKQTVLGSAIMAKESDKHPAELKDEVTSPGGTGITALHSMERGGLRALLIDAVEAATERSIELGEESNG